MLTSGEIVVSDRTGTIPFGPNLVGIPGASRFPDFSLALCLLGDNGISFRLVDGSFALHLLNNFGDVNAVPFSLALPRLCRKLKLPLREGGFGVSN